MNQRISDIQAIYRKGIQMLAEAGIAEAELDAWYLLEDVTGITKALYYSNPDYLVDDEKRARYFSGIRMRQRRVPLQHITGQQEFMGYSFFVNESVLIPRQDTETLVEEALKALHSGGHILDICTGSGCILLSLLKRGSECLGLSNLEGTGTDISEAALEVAKKNADRLYREAEFIKSDLFLELAAVKQKYHVIVSNPPYIPTKEIAQLQEEVRLHDPYIALDGREDGLYFYREIIKGSVNYLMPGGSLLMEIGYDQAQAVSDMMVQSGYESVHTKKDLAGLDRVVAGVYNKE